MIKLRKKIWVQVKNHTPWREPLKALTVGLQWQMFRFSNGKVNPSLWQQSKSPKGSKENRAEIKPDITDLYKKNMSCWHYGTWLQGNTQEYSRKMCVRLTSMSLTQLTARAHGKEWWSEPKGTDQAYRINERPVKKICKGKGKGKGYTAISASEGSWAIA